MTTVNPNKQVNNKNIIRSVVAGLAGAVAITGVAIAATVALKDERTRKKVKKTLINIKDQATEHVKTLKIKSNRRKKTLTAKKNATVTKNVVATSSQ